VAPASDRDVLGTAGTGTPAAKPSAGTPLLELEEVRQWFPVRSGGAEVVGRRQVRAVDGVSLKISAGETLGLVGESGCGKSTLARCAARLQSMTSGTVRFAGKDISRLSAHRLRPYRRRIQMVFQDPIGSLNPRRRVGSIIAEPLNIHRIGGRPERLDRVRQLMEIVGLNPEHFNRFPGEFSGGQRQRIGIARALAIEPELLICDEPVSALDVSIQAQIVNLLRDLQETLSLTYLFIAHDISVVEHVSDRIAVMYLGKIVELGTTDDVMARGRHPYSLALLSALPIADPDVEAVRRRVILRGDAPSAADPPSGCRFRTRCPVAQELCSEEEPPLRVLLGDAPGHVVACHFPIGDDETLTSDGRVAK
jgi:oligopeptide/dipeptide ABC transporter ATP-binding protein